MTGPIAPRILHAGESCLVVEFGGAIDLGVNARVQADYGDRKSVV